MERIRKRRRPGNPMMQKGAPSINPLGVAAIPVEVKEAARAHTMAAIQTLVDCLNHPQGSFRVAAANSLLDRAWGKPKESLEIMDKPSRIQIIFEKDDEIPMQHMKTIEHQP
jgi:hypothetical protein